MKNFTKFLAVILVIIIALSTAACSLTPQWSYKQGDNELAIGMYIYALHNAYTQAESYAQKTESYDAEAGTYDGKKSFLEVEITDDDGVTATADQWIKDKADKTLRTILAVDSEFDRLGATIDQATEENAKATAKEYWEYGPYYSMYGDQFKNPYKDVYEPLGVSYESFEYFYLASAKEQAVFKKLYNEGGEKAVSDKELTEYFEGNYTSYVYFNANLYESVEETDENGEAISTSKALSEDKISDYKNNFESYVNSVNAGTNVDDVINSFMSDEELETDPSVKNVEILSDSTIGEDLTEAISKLDNNTATYKIIGESDSQVIYFLYKESIKKQTKNYIEDETNRGSVLQKYKSEEFTDYLEGLADSLDVTINNKAVKQYKPKMFEK